MRNVCILLSSMMLVACADSQFISPKQLQKTAPTATEETGFLVTTSKSNDVVELSNKLPHSKIRIINKRHGLYEIYGVTKGEIQQYLKNTEITKNDFFTPNEYLPSQTDAFQNYRFNSSQKSNTLRPELCIRGPYPPSARINDLTNIKNSTIQLGESIHFDAHSSTPNISVKSSLRFGWSVETPDGSIKKSYFHFDDDELKVIPTAMGAYTITLRVQDELNKCHDFTKRINVTSNEDYNSLSTQDIRSSKILTEQLAQFSHLKELGVEKTWQVTTGHSQIIAVIDSGVNYNHFALKNNILFNNLEIPNNGIDDDNNGFIDDYLGYDLVNSDPFPYDDHGHGSHVAGISSSSVFGIAKDSKILAVKAMSPSGGDLGSLAGGIFYAVDRGAKILNLSFGNYGKAHPTMIKAVNYAEKKGAIIVAAAGNGDHAFGIPINTDIAPNYPSALNNDNIIAVAAKSNKGLLASYSNFGKKSVDVVAPGGDSDDLIFSAFHKNPANIHIKGMSGTSMASPIVAGISAQLWSLNPELTVREIKELLLKSGNYNKNLKDKVLSSRYISSTQAIDSLLNK